MATTVIDLPDCDKSVYNDGEVMFITHTIEPNDIEAWVHRVADMSGQKVDWHYFGGRAVIKALGNLDAVKKAMRSLMEEHDKRFHAAVKDIVPEIEQPAPRPKWWDEAAN